MLLATRDVSGQPVRDQIVISDLPLAVSNQIRFINPALPYLRQPTSLMPPSQPLPLRF